MIVCNVTSTWGPCEQTLTSPESWSLNLQVTQQPFELSATSYRPDPEEEEGGAQSEGAEQEEQRESENEEEDAPEVLEVTMPEAKLTGKSLTLEGGARKLSTLEHIPHPHGSMFWGVSVSRWQHQSESENLCLSVCL